MGKRTFKNAYDIYNDGPLHVKETNIKRQKKEETWEVGKSRANNVELDLVNKPTLCFTNEDAGQRGEYNNKSQGSPNFLVFSNGDGNEERMLSIKTIDNIPERTSTPIENFSPNIPTGYEAMSTEINFSVQDTSYHYPMGTKNYVNHSSNQQRQYDDYSNAEYIKSSSNRCCDFKYCQNSGQLQGSIIQRQIINQNTPKYMNEIDPSEMDGIMDCESDSDTYYSSGCNGTYPISQSRNI